MSRPILPSSIGYSTQRNSSPNQSRQAIQGQTLAEVSLPQEIWQQIAISALVNNNSAISLRRVNKYIKSVLDVKLVSVFNVLKKTIKNRDLDEGTVSEFIGMITQLAWENTKEEQGTTAHSLACILKLAQYCDWSLLLDSSRYAELTDLIKNHNRALEYICERSDSKIRFLNVNQIRHWFAYFNNNFLFDPYYISPFDPIKNIKRIEICQQSVIPPEIRNFKKINNLSIINSKINESHIVAIPDFIYQFKFLNSLRLSNNCIETISESIGNLTCLETLDVSNNNLSEMPESIGNLSKLKCLVISNNKLKNLPKCLEKIVGKLESIDITNNDLIEFPSYFLKRNFKGYFWMNLSRSCYIDEASIKECDLRFIQKTAVRCLIDGGKIQENAGRLLGDEVKQRRGELQYEAIEPIGKLYQQISKISPTKFKDSKVQENLQRAIFCLRQEDQNFLYLCSYEKSVGLSFSSDDAKLEWGKEHLFDDRYTFCSAVQSLIFKRYDWLSEECQYKTYDYYFKNLLGDDCKYFKPNLPLLIDSIEFQIKNDFL